MEERVHDQECHVLEAAEARRWWRGTPAHCRSSGCCVPRNTKCRITLKFTTRDVARPIARRHALAEGPLSRSARSRPTRPRNSGRRPWRNARATRGGLGSAFSGSDRGTASPSSRRAESAWDPAGATSEIARQRGAGLRFRRAGGRGCRAGERLGRRGCSSSRFSARDAPRARAARARRRCDRARSAAPPNRRGCPLRAIAASRAIATAPRICVDAAAQPHQLVGGAIGPAVREVDARGRPVLDATRRTSPSNPELRSSGTASTDVLEQRAATTDARQPGGERNPAPRAHPRRSQADGDAGVEDQQRSRATAGSAPAAARSAASRR